MAEEGSPKTNRRKSGGCIPMRYVVAVLASIGMAIIYGLKVNLSVAIVSMVNHTAVIKSDNQNTSHNVTSICPKVTGNSTGEEKNENGPFIWHENTQGLLLSAYFFGYLISQMPGGRISEMFSAKYVFFTSVLINVVCTLLTPIAAVQHYGVALLMRVLEGVGGGMTFPACHVLISKWAPPVERSIMSSMVYAGTALGTVIFMLTAGLIAGSWGWEAVFYIQGGVSAIWLILWVFLVYDTPQKHRFITQEEKKLITGTVTQEEKPKRLSIPWRDVLTSKPFWAILVAHVCSNWGWYMALTEIPAYLKKVHHMNIKKSATLTTIPFLCLWIFLLSLGKFLDVLRSKDKITTTTARKVATLIASVTPAICFVAISFVGCDSTAAVVLMTVAVTSIGGMFCGFLSNHIDIAPNFAGTLVAITNTLATIPGIVVPIFAGWLLEMDSSIRSWQIIFWITVALYVVEIVVYTAFGSGLEQPWNNPVDGNPVESQPLKTHGSPGSQQDRQSYESTNTARVEDTAEKN